MKTHVWILKRKGKKGFCYSIQWIDPRTGRRKTEAVGSDRAYANHKAAERRRELMDGQYRGIQSITYDDFVTEHLEQVSGQLAKGTCTEHELTLRQFRDVCNPKNLSNIDYSMLVRFRKARVDSGVSPATINKGLRTLQSIFERGIKGNYLKVNPFTGNRKALWVREPEPVIKTLEQKDFHALLDACHNAKWRAFCSIGFYAGLRQGEIRNLEWSDIDFERAEIYVRNKEDHNTKSGKNRSVPMSDHIRSVLIVLRPGVFQGSYVFRNMQGPRTNNNVNRDFSVIAVRAGLVDKHGKALFTPHDLRRSCATGLLNNGVPPKTVQKILGHANLSTTMRYYANVKSKDLHRAIEQRDAQTA
jgi:integrase